MSHSLKLHAVVAWLYLDLLLILNSLYLSSSCSYIKKTLFALFMSLPQPMLELWWFYLCHQLWGEILELICGFSLGYLNAGIPTFERFTIGTFSFLSILLWSISKPGSFLLGVITVHLPKWLQPDHHSIPRLKPAAPIILQLMVWSSWLAFLLSGHLHSVLPASLFLVLAEALAYFRETVLQAAVDHIHHSTWSYKLTTI